MPESEISNKTIVLIAFLSLLILFIGPIFEEVPTITIVVTFVFFLLAWMYSEIVRKKVGMIYDDTLLWKNLNQIKRLRNMFPVLVVIVVVLTPLKPKMMLFLGGIGGYFFAQSVHIFIQWLKAHRGKFTQ